MQVFFKKNNQFKIDNYIVPRTTDYKLSDLSTEQLTAFNKYKKGENILITGPAGTGKSFLINYIYNDAYKKGRKVQVCALTGCASILLKQCNSSTLHSWGGLGIANGTVETVISKIEKNYFKKKEWKQIKLLIVDEVSMLSEKLFNYIDIIGKYFKNNNLPFGGIQVIFLADFYQLPPVGINTDETTKNFCFESEKWFTTFPLENHIILKNIFRQTDEIYKNILNQVRVQQLDETGINILQNLTTKTKPKDVIITKILPKKKMVDYINYSELNKLDTEEQVFTMKFATNPIYNENQSVFEHTNIKNALLCEETILLKIGSKVMCIINMSCNDIVNGSCGTIIEFTSNGLPVVEFSNNKRIIMDYNVWESENFPGITVSQIPLIYAWAITIHKCQGITLDYAEIDVGTDIFETGQTYVALSRVKTLDGLYLNSFDENKIKANDKVINFYNKIN